MGIKWWEKSRGFLFTFLGQQQGRLLPDARAILSRGRRGSGGGGEGVV